MKATDKKDNDIRELYFSDEFVEFYGTLQDKVKVKILLLNGFLKKSTKDYSKQIKIAERILKDFEL